MKAGVCTIAFKDRSLDEAIELIAASGAKGLELWGRSPHLPASSAERRRLAARLRDAGLEICALGSYYRTDGSRDGGPPLAVPSASERDTEPDYVLEAAHDLGAPLVRIWPGSEDYERCPVATREAVVREIRAFGDRARDAGCAVVLERHNGTLTNGWDSARAVIAAVDHPSVSLCYQVPYPAPAQELATRVRDDLASLLPHSRHAHLQNYVEAADGTLPRTLLGEGIVDYRPITAIARESGYGGWAMVEFVGPVRGARSEAEALAADIAFIESL